MYSPGVYGKPIGENKSQYLDFVFVLDVLNANELKSIAHAVLANNFGIRSSGVKPEYIFEKGKTFSAGGRTFAKVATIRVSNFDDNSAEFQKLASENKIKLS